MSFLQCGPMREHVQAQAFNSLGWTARNGSYLEARPMKAEALLLAKRLQRNMAEVLRDMRLLITAIMTIGVATAACNRNAAVAASATVANAAAIDAPRDSDSAAVATSGGTESDLAAAAAVRALTIPAGTRLPIVLDTPVSSASSRVEQS